jgi:hypothetical protein
MLGFCFNIEIYSVTDDVRLLVFDKFVNMRQLFAYVEKNTENE